MRPPKFYTRLAALSLAALFALAPAAAPAQQRGGGTGPGRGTQRTTTTATPAPAATPSAVSRPAPAATPTRTPPRPAARAEDADPPGAADIDRPFNELVGAEGYALYVEMRSLGRLMRSKEIKDLLDLVRLVGAGSKEVENALGFYTTHPEQLEGTTGYALVMPTRSALPQFVSAYEFPSAEAARAFEPTARGMVEKFDELVSGEQQKAPAQGPPGAAGAGRQPQQQKPPAPDGLKLQLKRYGRVLIVSSEPFTLKRLRGEEESPLASNQRLQSLRSRLATEPLFVFFDVTLSDRIREAEYERMARDGSARAEMEAASRTAPAEEPASTQTGASAATPDAQAQPEATPVVVVTEPTVVGETEPELAGTPADGEEEGGPPPPPGQTPPPGAVVAGGAQGSTEDEEEQQQAGRASEMVLSALFGRGMSAVPRWPEAVGAALDLDGDSFVLRAVLVNDAADEVLPLPFLPTVISGPQLTTQAASVAPSESEVFISVSLDLTRMFNRIVGMADEQMRMAGEMRKTSGKGGGGEREEELSTEKSLAALEKLLGFKIREDFLPAVGNEVAISVPLRWFTGERGYNYGYRGKDKEQRGPVVLVALNNVEGVQRMLPRLLEMTGVKPLTSPGQTISHGGYQIHQYGSLSVAYLNNFAALSWEQEAVRRFIDETAASGPLSSDERYRAATSWAPRQRLGEAYVSRTLVEQLNAEMLKWADPADEEVQRIIARLNIRPESITYAVTGEGTGLLAHELRLPVALVKLFAADSILSSKVTPVRNGEQSALYVLTTARSSEEERKKAGKGYGTFEELSTPDEKARERVRGYRVTVEHPLSKAALDRAGYHFELRPAGDKYTLVATPKEYRKTGRRSFYLDETGLIRGADHAGEPATANDPPVD